MSKKKKRNKTLPRPERMQTPPADKDRTTRRDWENYIRTMIKNYKKTEKRTSNIGFLATSELTGAFEQRRIEAALNLMDAVYARYGAYADGPHNILGEEWVHLNFLFNTYSRIESQSYIVTAAAIWILDRIRERDRNWRELLDLLPADSSVLDEMVIPDVWDPYYEEDLIYSVQYILQQRNAPVAESPGGYLQCITDERTAKGTHRTDTPERKTFESLLSLIPEEDIRRATERFETLFWSCSDRVFAVLEPLTRRRLENKALLEAQQNEYNRKLDVFLGGAKQWETSMYHPQKKLAAMPGDLPDLRNFSESAGVFSASKLLAGETGMNPYKQALLEQAFEMDAIAEKCDELSNQTESDTETHFMLTSRLTSQGYLVNCSEYGDEAASKMKRLDIRDPFELCFALLYLTDQGSDLPWAYGIGTSLMSEVTENLPWGVIEYDEIEDDIWNAEDEGEPVKVPANASIPDVWERQHARHGNEDDGDQYPRSISQLVYEETGCLLPRDMHLYDRKIRRLRQFGFHGKDAAVALASMSILAQARRQRIALNFESDFSLWNHEDDGKEEQEETETARDSEQVRQLKEEPKRLRNALHDADRASRDARRELESVKEKAALERRELADLRELVFESNEDQEPFVEEETADVFPYSVQRNTVIFGGHPSWEKAIRPLLNGNIRFVDKDLISFDLALIRGADIIWIQSNAMSHKMYYRIIDTARQYKKSVRYFTNASAVKCAMQVTEEDGHH